MAIFEHAYPKISESFFSVAEFIPAKNISKNISFYLLIFEIQSTLESHDQTEHTHFLIMPTQKSAFTLSKFVSSGYFNDLFWRYGLLKNYAI